MMSMLRVSHVVFCCAYVFGFILCLLLLKKPVPEAAVSKGNAEIHSGDAVLDNYHQWLSKSGLLRSPLSADIVSYGDNVTTEADFLK